MDEEEFNNKDKDDQAEHILPEINQKQRNQFF